jgi:hypothetical protein
MALNKIRLPNGEELVIDEWLHWPQFSTIEFAAGIAINLRAFTYVAGQQIPQAGAVPGGKRTSNESDTNQTARTRMNHDEAFLAYSLTYEHFALTDAHDDDGDTVLSAPAPLLEATNLRRLQRDVVVALTIGAGIDKPQFRAPLSWIDQGVGAPAYGSGDAVAAGVAISYGTAGPVSPKSQRQWKLPIFIASDRVMHLNFKSEFGAITDLTQAARFRWYIDGLKRRPVA